MARLRRAARSIGVVVLLAAFGLGVYTWRHSSTGAEVYSGGNSIAVSLPLRNGPEHDAARQRNGGEPYILEVEEAGSGAIVYYGASHTRSPDHPQIADIEARWTAFRPTVGLYEGCARRYFYGPLIEPLAGLPEPALVQKLARRDGVQLYSLESAYENEVAALLANFPPEHVVLYFFLRVYVLEAGGVANDRLAAALLDRRSDVQGLRGSLPSLAAIDRVWRRDFPESGEWRTLTAEPDNDTFARMSHESRRIRGEHMIRILTDLARNGERVFAVVGSGHVIRQEWNLRALFGLEPAWDQPPFPREPVR